MRSGAALARMARRYLVHESEMDSQTFLDLTDNWIELTACFVIPVRSARRIKSDISQKVLRRYAEEGIAIAFATTEIVGFPLLRVEGLRGLGQSQHQQGGGMPEQPSENRSGTAPGPPSPAR